MDRGSADIKPPQAYDRAYSTGHGGGDNSNSAKSLLEKWGNKAKFYLSFSFS